MSQKSGTRQSKLRMFRFFIKKLNAAPLLFLFREIWLRRISRCPFRAKPLFFLAYFNFEGISLKLPFLVEKHSFSTECAQPEIYIFFARHVADYLELHFNRRTNSDFKKGISADSVFADFAFVFVRMVYGFRYVVRVVYSGKHVFYADCACFGRNGCFGLRCFALGYRQCDYEFGRGVCESGGGQNQQNFRKCENRF